jgi:hypothetical protein
MLTMLISESAIKSLAFSRRILKFLAGTNYLLSKNTFSIKSQDDETIWAVELVIVKGTY